MQMETLEVVHRESRRLPPIQKVRTCSPLVKAIPKLVCHWVCTSLAELLKFVLLNNWSK